MRNPQSGLTLIELVLALAIMALIVTISHTAYLETKLATNRSEAREALLDLARLQSDFHKECGHFARHLGKVNDCSKAILAFNNDLPRYSLSVSTSGEGYSLTATAKTEQVRDTACKELKLTLFHGALQKESPTCWKTLE